MGDNVYTTLIAAAARLDMPFQRDHISWADRTRREKLIIVMFYGIMLALVLNIIGWMAFICVFMQHDKYSAYRGTGAPVDGHNATSSYRALG
ncbi:uncharacterized protein Dmoj_GI25679 [Drosophila mojavensis]|uniref:Uncharacterized protein n=1 Tax=Drosophila mojavensis TaxID=7230 RepID=A0A0Q9X240_DROMO|nr:uncharacterized protein Dmoj_GI25679 [Drosophila mojavensis]